MEMLFLILPWLAILACPLMMFVMMRMMPSASCHQRAAGAQENQGTEQKIHQLQARIAELESNQAAEAGR